MCCNLCISGWVYTSQLVLLQGITEWQLWVLPDLGVYQGIPSCIRRLYATECYIGDAALRSVAVMSFAARRSAHSTRTSARVFGQHWTGPMADPWGSSADAGPLFDHMCRARFCDCRIEDCVSVARVTLISFARALISAGSSTLVEYLNCLPIQSLHHHFPYETSMFFWFSP